MPLEFLELSNFYDRDSRARLARSYRFYLEKFGSPRARSTVKKLAIIIRMRAIICKWIVFHLFPWPRRGDVPTKWRNIQAVPLPWKTCPLVCASCAFIRVAYKLLRPFLLSSFLFHFSRIAITSAYNYTKPLSDGFIYKIKMSLNEQRRFIFKEGNYLFDSLYKR